MPRGRTKGSDKISLWLAKQSEQERAAFLDYARAHYHSKTSILTYLVDRKCDVALSTVYQWVGQNVQPGEQAVLFNRDTQDFAGVELVPALEKILVQLSNTSKKFYDLIDNCDTIQPQDVLSLLPQYAREMRATAAQITTIRQRIDAEALIMTGATRVLEIVMGTAGIRDTSDEEFVRQAIEAAILQIAEEMKSKSSVGTT